MYLPGMTPSASSDSWATMFRETAVPTNVEKCGQMTAFQTSTESLGYVTGSDQIAINVVG